MVFDAIYGATKIFSMKVSENLVEALRSLRYSDKVRDMWIDQVCIDQDNTTERNIQVGRMAEVYGNADNVCVWLGAGSESSKVALDFIRDHVLQLRRFDHLTENNEYLEKWKAFIELMKRPW